MSRRRIAFFSMPEEGHFRRLLPLISGLAGCGPEICVFTHERFASEVERAGGVFYDLFSRYSLEDESSPVPCRYVTFAGEHAGEIRRDLERTGAALVVHDTFAVVGHAAASLLGLPSVNVCAGHKVTPAAFLAGLSVDPRVKIAPRCLRAVDRLRESFGLIDASPFSYVSARSRHLNVYGEPPEFLDEQERSEFEPIAFYGCLPSVDKISVDRRHGVVWPGGSGNLRVYVSFGTVVWRYYASRALRVLRVLASAFAEMEHLSAIVSLGGVEIDGSDRFELQRPNVSVESYVDQHRVLQEADLFVTHHGMNSTHEAIFHRVPMVSYPFFWDQPALATKCQEFGLSVPLTAAVGGEVDAQSVRAALERLTEGRETMMAALCRARAWEEAVIRMRPVVHKRILRLLEQVVPSPSDGPEEHGPSDFPG
jgi:MGT family glycosyltransferase